MKNSIDRAASNDVDPRDAGILIVGAGPTGLALALSLAQAGIDFLIVDRLTKRQDTSRAAVIHAHTLEVLQPLGVVPRLLAAGLRLSTFSVRDGDQVLARLPFDGLPSPYACLLMLPQDRTEAILEAALERLGHRVQRGWQVDALRESGDRVVAQVSTNAGPRTVRARYAVGADGMHSVVRTAAGIAFTGHPYEGSFVLADVDLDWDQGRGEVMLFFSPPGPVVVAPLPDGRFRVVASLANAPEHPDAADVETILRSRGPAHGNPSVRAVHWSSRFQLHHRVADHYRRDRLFLVGDAAHVHSPAGGQGMNTGLVDAVVLGRLLGDVIAGRRPETDLDWYERLRRPAARQVLSLAGRLTAAAMIEDRPRRALRNLAFRLVGALPPLRRRLALNLSGIRRRAASRLPGDAEVPIESDPRDVVRTLASRMRN